ncbi:GNAT family N-acetyltransferase [Methylobacillus flagellatus]|uniref:Acetyltransferase, GNAT family n=1 Tax=Methylobacillus flagellatus (strain ATCC 51484 / DSM 6875 / VKM B-1610 / KT) TaxID=265072 RepID=Q1H481_METFK|nr:GNAT family N-acetyltransferase [Methylobacillus flagellatus]ABE48706.1 Acetyltransferase, GNAT family [Methylobacillus flagellatus KT]
MTEPVAILRTAEPADIPALCGLLQQLFSIEQDFTPNPAKQAAGLRLLLGKPDRGAILVAVLANGEVIGMVSAQLVVSTAQGSPAAWIEDMVIDAQYRGLGLGRQLLHQALDWAKAHGATRAQLLVDMDNQPAIAYYDHLGWNTTRLQARNIFL